MSRLSDEGRDTALLLLRLEMDGWCVVVAKMLVSLQSVSTHNVMG